MKDLVTSFYGIFCMFSFGLQICEFAMKVTNGEVPRNEVPLTVRQPLLNVWLQAKQLASQSIGKGLGCDDDVSVALFFIIQMRRHLLFSTHIYHLEGKIFLDACIFLHVLANATRF